MQYQHWRVEHNDNFTTVYFDEQDSTVNRLGTVTMKELGLLITHLAAEPRLKAVVFRSGKTKGFIAGANVHEFTQVTDVNEAFTYVRECQNIMQQLAKLPVPTIAWIQGFCLGGGLELALACDYRICDDTPHTKLGLPEVMVGIHPGWGGSVRLPELVGVLSAMDLLLSGRSIDGKTAKAIGLVDYVLPERELAAAVSDLLLNTPTRHKPVWWQRLLAFAPLRSIVAGLLRRRLLKRITPAHYPAPFAIIDNWQRHGSGGESAMIAEAHSAAKLVMTPTAHHLLKVFFLRERLRGLATTEHHIKHVHVIGAGVMGGDIAAWCALQGMTVTLEDNNLEALGRSIARAQNLFKHKIKRTHLIKAAQDRLIVDPLGHGLKSADLIIEAIVEDVALKRELWTRVLEQARPDALLATNTSSILLSELTAGWASPERLVGIHFFNPVAKMPLVEVVSDAITDQHCVQRACAFVKAIDKLPLPVASVPGFLVNRVLAAYMMTAITLAAEGYDYHVIDQLAMDYGMPMGPLALCDVVGLDVCLAAARHILGEDITVPAILTKRIEAGHLGKKTGQGFYHYAKDGHKTPTATGRKGLNLSADDLINPILAASKAALAEGVVADADLVDAGMIFGAGFPPFTGGPMTVLAANGA